MMLSIDALQLARLTFGSKRFETKEQTLRVWVALNQCA